MRVVWSLGNYLASSLPAVWVICSLLGLNKNEQKVYHAGNFVLPAMTWNAEGCCPRYVKSSKRWRERPCDFLRNIRDNEVWIDQKQSLPLSIALYLCHFVRATYFPFVVVICVLTYRPSSFVRCLRAKTGFYKCFWTFAANSSGICT